MDIDKPKLATDSRSELQPVHRRFVDELQDRLKAHKDPIKYRCKARVEEKYEILGFIGSGAYGRVYKAFSLQDRNHNRELFAIKKFRPVREGERPTYAGISQSAIQEMSICSELNHINVIKMAEVILEDISICIVFEYAEYDLQQIICHHHSMSRQPIQSSMIRSIMFQLINGCKYIHTNRVMHRDIKPANIMVKSSGVVKIGDFGLARCFDQLPCLLSSANRVVGSLWYRAPELLLGNCHYVPAIDMWAVGCCFADLLSLEPIFPGVAVKRDGKNLPYQRGQMNKIVEILGIPSPEQWPLAASLPQYFELLALVDWPKPEDLLIQDQTHPAMDSCEFNFGEGSSNLEKWYNGIIQDSTLPKTSFNIAPYPEVRPGLGSDGYEFLAGLLEYDPEKRLTAERALNHDFFRYEGELSMNCFEGLAKEYPTRQVRRAHNDIWAAPCPGMKRGCVSDSGQPNKKAKRS